MSNSAPSILLTGATGYVGGRLLPILEQRGESIRCLVRRPENLQERTQASTQIVAGDVLEYRFSSSRSGGY